MSEMPEVLPMGSWDKRENSNWFIALCMAIVAFLTGCGRHHHKDEKKEADSSGGASYTYHVGSPGTYPGSCPKMIYSSGGSATESPPHGNFFEGFFGG